MNHSLLGYCSSIGRVMVSGAEGQRVKSQVGQELGTKTKLIPLPLAADLRPIDLWLQIIVNVAKVFVSEARCAEKPSWCLAHYLGPPSVSGPDLI